MVDFMNDVNHFCLRGDIKIPELPSVINQCDLWPMRSVNYHMKTYN